MTTPENDETVTYVDEDTWNWLQERLAEPPKANPKLVELMKKARGAVEFRD